MSDIMIWIMMMVPAFCLLLLLWGSRTKSRALTSFVILVMIMDVVFLLFYVMKYQYVN